jgi:electron transfer flavoprotein alpha subunit
VRAVSDVVEVLTPVEQGDPVEGLTAVLGRHGADVVRVVRELPATAPPRTAVVSALHEQQPFDLVAMETSSLAADVAGALAVRIGAGVCWDLVGLEDSDGELRGRRLALGDTVLVDTAWVGEPAIALLRAGALDPGDVGDPRAPQVLEVDPPLDFGPDISLSTEGAEGGVRSSALDTADVIVAGGRGLGSADNLALLEELAETLGGVVGVSMPVVDRGWYPYEHQVGQTGHTVRPKLYVACGISGAVQHRVGMSRSGAIIAINSDPHAPIFDFCDLGVVGDLTEVVPRITAALRRR